MPAPSYDYVPLVWPRCEMPVSDASQPMGERECGRPAFWRMFWHSDEADAILLCTDHWRMLIRQQGDDPPPVDRDLEADNERPLAF